MRYFKLLLLVFTLSTFTSPQTANAQKYKFDQWELRSGIGLTPTFIKDHAKTELQPLSFELRYRPNKKFSLGFLAGTSISQSYQKHHTGENRMVRNHFKMAALRGAVHSAPNDKWDCYGGLLLAYTKNDLEYTEMPDEKGNEPSFFPVEKPRDGLFFSAFVGSSYKVYKKIHLFGELSYGLSIATAGIAVKL